MIPCIGHTVTMNTAQRMVRRGVIGEVRMETLSTRLNELLKAYNGIAKVDKMVRDFTSLFRSLLPGHRLCAAAAGQAPPLERLGHAAAARGERDEWKQLRFPPTSCDNIVYWGTAWGRCCRSRTASCSRCSR